MILSKNNDNPTNYLGQLVIFCNEDKSKFKITIYDDYDHQAEEFIDIDGDIWNYLIPLTKRTRVEVYNKLRR